MDLLFPIGVAILLLLFLATNFDLVATLVNYLLMICLIVAVSAAVGYGLYNSLGQKGFIFLAIVGAGLLGMTNIGRSIARLIKGLAERSRADSLKKT